MHPAALNRSRTRILVIANETAPSDTLYDTVRAQVDGLGSTRVLVVAPVLDPRLRHWLSDEDDARKSAVRRLQLCVERLVRAGVDAEGAMGDADPLRAIDDALTMFPAGQLIIATHPEGGSNWLAQDLVGRAARRFGLPVTHIVIEMPADHGRGESRRTALPADDFLAA